MSFSKFSKFKKDIKSKTKFLWRFRFNIFFWQTCEQYYIVRSSYNTMPILMVLKLCEVRCKVKYNEHTKNNNRNVYKTQLS